MNTNTGICPVCNGTKEIPLSAEDKKYSWNKDKTHKVCYNCGGQRMYGIATGIVPLRIDGTPCKHEYEGIKMGRCYYKYTCKHCNYSYDIDSSD